MCDLCTRGLAAPWDARCRDYLPRVTPAVTPEPVPVTDAVTQGPLVTAPVTPAGSHCPGCRCPKYASNAAKQKAYRERRK